MKTSFLNTALFGFALTLFTACGGEQKQNAETTEITEQTGTNQEVAGATYTCPMHPEVVSHEPGKCPKCGMNLEKATSQEHTDEDGHNH